jgi:hypothetical protein
METRRGKREREQRQEAPPAAAPSSGSSSSSSSVSSSSSSSSSSSASTSSAAAPFRGPVADSALGERLIDVIGIVAAMGFAAEVSHCLYLCGETWRKGDKGATNDMLARSVEKQGWAALLRAARTAKREDFFSIRGTTQLMRAARDNDLPRVLQLVQLGAPLGLKDKDGFTALHLACFLGHEHVVRALLDGKYEGCGAEFDARSSDGCTPLMWASFKGHEGVVRLLLARGARQELQDRDGWTALHHAAVCDSHNHAGVVALLCAAPGAAASLALRNSAGQTPLGMAIERGSAACKSTLRAHGAPL